MVWIKSVVRLRVVPIYAMMVENLPPWARKEIDVIWRKFFWVASDADVRGKCMVAWMSVAGPHSWVASVSAILSWEDLRRK